MKLEFTQEGIMKLLALSVVLLVQLAIVFACDTRRNNIWLGDECK